jgi:hypothetical protein
MMGLCSLFLSLFLLAGDPGAGAVKELEGACRKAVSLTLFYGGKAYVIDGAEHTLLLQSFTVRGVKEDGVDSMAASKVEVWFDGVNLDFALVGMGKTVQGETLILQKGKRLVEVDPKFLTTLNLYMSTRLKVPSLNVLKSP